jgi:hypothetical protein
MPLVTDKMVEDALQWLARSDELAAGAKANRVRMEHRREMVRAKLMLESNETSDNKRRAWAECQPRYVEAVENEADAVEADETHRNKRNTCNAIIEAWRSEQANKRAGSNFR